MEFNFSCINVYEIVSVFIVLIKTRIHLQWHQSAIKSRPTSICVLVIKIPQELFAGNGVGTTENYDDDPQFSGVPFSPLIEINKLTWRGTAPEKTIKSDGLTNSSREKEINPLFKNVIFRNTMASELGN